MKTTVVTVTNRIPTEPYYRFGAWKDSVQRFGIDPVVLGLDQRWDGLITKPRTLLKWLKNGGADCECLIFMDSWDCLMLEHPESIAERWKDVGAPWICGAERNLFPPADEKPWPACGTPYRFLNSGVILSTPDDMLKVLEAMNPDNLPNDHERPDGSHFHSNDQEWLQQLFLRQPIPMRLDHECKFVWNLCDVPDDQFEMRDGKVFNKETGTYPGICHANGSSKEKPIFLTILDHVSKPKVQICATTE